ncbi:MAG: stage V sporulation protein T [Lachnospiraceae bacterium]|nr:stage V sporulation protein T [Lachnospiraceae bacterium]
MRATGIVRRIDDLGRIVIPKEIRRTLRLREGTPLEIFTDREGEVILKKYSPMAELGGFAGQYAEALAQNSGHMVCITDRDQVIAAAGGLRKDLLQRGLSRGLEQAMHEREVLMTNKGEKGYVPVVEDEPEEIHGEVMVPILCEGDVIGSVILLNREDAAPMGEAERKLAGTAAGFLGKQMEG